MPYTPRRILFERHIRVEKGLLHDILRLLRLSGQAQRKDIQAILIDLHNAPEMHVQVHRQQRREIIIV